jgi:hypothetical protein
MHDAFRGENVADTHIYDDMFDVHLVRSKISLASCVVIYESPVNLVSLYIVCCTV